MQTQSKYEYQPFEHSGSEVRFHWNVESFNVEADPDLHCKAEECLCLDTDQDEVILLKLQAEECPEDIQYVLLLQWNNYKQGT